MMIQIISSLTSIICAIGCVVCYRKLGIVRETSYQRGYERGFIEGKDSVIETSAPEWAATESEIVYSTLDNDVYAPDTSDWSDRIPPATRQKLIEGITSYNRATDRKRTTKKF